VAEVRVVVEVPDAAPFAGVDGELLDDDPQPATTSAATSATAKTESLLMGRQAPDLT
jgi:hypothetical protein